MGVRVVLGLVIAVTLPGGYAGASMGGPGPQAGHEQLCNQAHGSTAPQEIDRAMHERFPRSAMNQLCDPHSGHDDDGDGRPDDEAG